MRKALLVAAFSLMAAPVWAAGLFGSLEIKANSIQSIPKWVDALQRIHAENLVAKCRAGTCDDDQKIWYAMVKDLKGLDKYEQMVRVDRWFNRYPYKTDQRLWGKSDFWETPGQFVDLSGDCEDYAIAKYYTLKVLGWNDADLRLVILRDNVREVPHAVLAAKYGADTYILDNLATEPLQDKYITQYTPYYAVNETTRWVFIQPVRQ